MSFFVDELEDQRKELEARRLVLEERYKLRLATAQEFGVIHTRRLGRIREAFETQCNVAQRRNQAVVQRVRQSQSTFFGEGVHRDASVSRTRLSYQTERFLSTAHKLYPAWQGQQLYRKATELRNLEEERFVTEQRRRSARDNFEQEQVLQAAVEERRRRLAAARAHERNELALWRAQRERATAQGHQALLEILEREDDAARTARRRVLAEVTNHHHNSDRTDLASEYGGAGTGRCGDAPSDEESSPETSIWCLDGKARRGVASSDKGRVGKRREERRDTGKVAGERGCRAELLEEHGVHRPRERNELDDPGEPEQEGGIGADLDARARNGPYESPPIVRTTRDETAVASTTGMPTSIPVTRHQSNKQLLEPPPSSQAHHSGDRPHTHSADVIVAEQGTPEPLSPPQAASLGRKARGGSFSSSERSAPLTDNNTLPNSRAVYRKNSDHARGGNEGVLEVGLADDGCATTEEAEAAAAAKRISSGSEDQLQQADRRSLPHAETRREGEKPINAGVGPHGEIEAAEVDADSTTHGHLSESERSAEAGRPTSPEDARPHLSLPAASRALVALTLQIETLASQASEAAEGRGEQAPSSPAPIVLDGYGSVDAAPSGDRNAATARATAAAPGEDRDRIGEFSLSTLCGAVLDLITARAGDIIPAEVLSGRVSVATVRAQHRRKGPPGRVQLFDAFVSHARRVVAWGEIGPDAVAGVFAPCFELVVARVRGGGGGGGAERLRRKMFALLQSAADADTPASTNASSTTTPTASARLTPSEAHGGGGSSKTGVRRIPRDVDATVPDARDDRARVDEVGATQPQPPMRYDQRRASSRRQQEQQEQRATDDEQGTENSQLSLARLDTSNNSDTARDDEAGPARTAGGVPSQGRTGQSAGHGGSAGGRVAGKPSPALGESNPTSSRTRSVSEPPPLGTTVGSGVVLGGSGRTGRKKKGSLNLSAMGMMGIFSAGGGALPEFEMDESLEDQW